MDVSVALQITPHPEASNATEVTPHRFRPAWTVKKPLGIIRGLIFPSQFIEGRLVASCPAAILRTSSSWCSSYFTRAQCR